MIGQLIQAAFYPPSRAADAADQAPFAVLPQNTQNELDLSECHSNLDKALKFLQRDLGYALLDDVRPHSGGGVRLKDPPTRVIHAVQKGALTNKLPKAGFDEPPVRTATSPAGGGEELDDSIIKLLRVIFQRSGGKLRVSELADVVHNVRLNGQLDRLLRGVKIDQDREISWEEFETLHRASKVKADCNFCHCTSCGKEWPAPGPRDLVPGLCACGRKLQDGRLEAREGSERASASTGSPPKATDPQIEEVSSLSPEVSRYAHFECDLVLTLRFTHILYKSILQDVMVDADAGLTTPAEAKRRCSMAVKNDGVYKCVLQGVRLMHLCDYDYADVVLVLGYATVYFRSTFSSIGKKMSPNEAAHVVVLLIYLAHSFLLDETCPLRIWQKHIFRKYCTLKVLDAALFRLFQMRPGFKLRISDEEERMALLGLSGFMYPLAIAGDEKTEANDAIKQLMGTNLTHPKLLSENKDVASAGNATNGHAAEPTGNQNRNRNGASSPPNSTQTAAPAAHSGSSSGGSNYRSPQSTTDRPADQVSPPGSGQLHRGTVPAPRITIDRSAPTRQQVPLSVAASREARPLGSRPTQMVLQQ